MDTILNRKSNEKKPLVYLHHANLFRVLIAREKLSHMARSITLRQIFFFEECDDERCRSRMGKLARSLLLGPLSDGFIDPLTDPIASGGRRGLCQMCFESLQSSIARGRVEVWKGLAQVFGFGKQDAVRKDSDEHT